MYYYGFRFYDPNLQRWINRDPLGDPGFGFTFDANKPPFATTLIELPQGPNLYGFVRNNPLTRHDAYGLECLNYGPNETTRPIDQDPKRATIAGGIMAAGAVVAALLVGGEAFAALDALAARLTYRYAYEAYLAQRAATAAAAAKLAQAQKNLNLMNSYSKGYEAAEAGVANLESALDTEQKREQALLEAADKAGQALKCMGK
jgi:RHS repeat-associated protein